MLFVVLEIRIPCRNVNRVTNTASLQPRTTLTFIVNKENKPQVLPLTPLHFCYLLLYFLTSEKRYSSVQKSICFIEPKGSSPLPQKLASVPVLS
jgi:hypothetical protein